MKPPARPLRRIAALPFALALAAAATAGSAEADTAAPLAAFAVPGRTKAPAPADKGTVLKRLPAGSGELTMRGEYAVRTLTMNFGRTEAARTAVLQLALLNAVSILPERSVVKVAINGTTVASVQPASADKPTVLPVRLPPGVLVPGPNTIQITAALTHRVDCSVQATYELWASLDAAQTGFLVPREASLAARTVADLGLEPLAEDGTTRIHLRLPDNADLADVAQAGRVIDALVQRARLPRPVVDVGPDRGTGAGFDVVLARGAGDEATAQSLTVVGRGEGLVLARDPETDRLVVSLPATDASDADRVIDALVAAAKPAAPGSDAVQQGFRKTFAELGIPAAVFTGRHYTSSVDIDLPPDFLAADDRASLLIDGTQSASLVEGDELVFRVNGTLVSSIPLPAGKADRFDHAVVDLPLRFFHPGHNDLSIEGVTSAVADGQCDTVAMPREPRLTIASTSELDFPRFAHLAMLPQIPAALAYDVNAEDGRARLYLPDADRASIGAGLTVLANMTAGRNRVVTPDIRIGVPAASDPPGVVVAPLAQLPEAMTEALHTIAVPVEPQPAAADVALPPVSPAALPDTPAEAVDPAPLRAAAVPPAVLTMDVHTAMKGAQALLRSRGFFYAGDGQSNLLPLGPSTLMVAAIAPEVTARTIFGLKLPQVTRDPAHWLVVTAADAPSLTGGLQHLVSGGHWAGLGGQAIAFDPESDTIHTVRTRNLTYVMPHSLVLADVRPILGGILSDNIVLSMGLLLVLVTLLGTSTHVLLRRVGVR